MTTSRDTTLIMIYVSKYRPRQTTRRSYETVSC